MPDPFRKVRSGEPLTFPAAAYNAFVDAALAHRREQHDQPRRQRPVTRDLDRVLVRNVSGGNRQRFDVVRIGPAGGVLIPPDQNLVEFLNRPVLVGTAPAERQPFAVLLEPVRAGELAEAAVSGLVPVQIDGVSGEFPPFAALKGETPAVLTGVTEPTGCEVLYRQDGDGLQWGLVRLSTTKHNCPEVHGLAILGSADGGEFDCSYLIAGQSALLTFGCTASASEVRSEFETHPAVGSGGVVCAGGPLPSPVFVRFAGDLEGLVISLPILTNRLSGNPQADPSVWWASTADWRLAVTE